MNKCLICNNQIHYHLDLAWIMTFKPIIKKYICKRCANKFVRIDINSICDGCGRPSKKKMCRDCLLWQEKFSDILHNRSMFVYNNLTMKEYFERYKFMGDYQYRLVFKQEFQEFIKKYYDLKKWLLVPIPVSAVTLNKVRGFNQVEGLLEGMKYHSLLSVIPDDKIKQSHKNRQERLKSKQFFQYTGSKNNSVSQVLLVDDIYTTGTTLYHAKKLLHENGVTKVKSITLAR